MSEPRYFLRMHGTIYLPMKDGETKDDAFDRVLEALDALDVGVSAWDELEVLDGEDGGDEDE